MGNRVQMLMRQTMLTLAVIAYNALAAESPLLAGVLLLRLLIEALTGAGSVNPAELPQFVLVFVLIALAARILLAWLPQLLLYLLLRRAGRLRTLGALAGVNVALYSVLIAGLMFTLQPANWDALGRGNWRRLGASVVEFYTLFGLILPAALGAPFLLRRLPGGRRLLHAAFAIGAPAAERPQTP